MIEQVFDVECSFFPEAAVYNYALLEAGEFKRIADRATVICVVGSNPNRNTIAFGLGVMEAISAKVIPPQNLNIVAFKVQFGGQEFQRFLADVVAVKLCHDCPYLS